VATVLSSQALVDEQMFPRQTHRNDWRDGDALRRAAIQGDVGRLSILLDRGVNINAICEVWKLILNECSIVS
jgi:hypothetical protein